MYKSFIKQIRKRRAFEVPHQHIATIPIARDYVNLFYGVLRNLNTIENPILYVETVTYTKTIMIPILERQEKEAIKLNWLDKRVAFCIWQGIEVAQLFHVKQ